MVKKLRLNPLQAELIKARRGLNFTPLALVVRGPQSFTGDPQVQANLPSGRPQYSKATRESRIL